MSEKRKDIVCATIALVFFFTGVAGVGMAAAMNYLDPETIQHFMMK